MVIYEDEIWVLKLDLNGLVIEFNCGILGNFEVLKLIGALIRHLLSASQILFITDHSHLLLDIYLSRSLKLSFDLIHSQLYILRVGAVNCEELEAVVQIGHFRYFYVLFEVKGTESLKLVGVPLYFIFKFFDTINLTFFTNLIDSILVLSNQFVIIMGSTPYFSKSSLVHFLLNLIRQR